MLGFFWVWTSVLTCGSVWTSVLTCGSVAESIRDRDVFNSRNFKIKYLRINYKRFTVIQTLVLFTIDDNREKVILHWSELSRGTSLQLLNRWDWFITLGIYRRPHESGFELKLWYTTSNTAVITSNRHRNLVKVRPYFLYV